MKKFLIAKSGFFREKIDGGTTETTSAVTGHLVNITFKRTVHHGDIIRLHILDQENFYLLSFFANSRCGHAFYMLIKNVDLHAPVTFKIKLVNGRDVFYAIQNGESVLWFFGIDKAEPLPSETEKRLAFLKDMVETNIIRVLRNKLNPYPAHPVYKPFTKSTVDPYAKYRPTTSVKSHISGNNEVDEC